jgi:hypothetical protein
MFAGLMLVLMSSGVYGCDLGECGGGAVFEFGSGAGADLETLELLVGDPEGFRQDGDRHARLFPLSAELLADGGIGSGAFRGA